MILLDWLGLLVSAILLGPFYLFYVFFLSLLQESTRLLLLLLLDYPIEKVFISGVFGFTSWKGMNPRSLSSILLILSGHLFSFFIYRLAGGVGKNPPWAFFNPLIKVKRPLAMVSLRFGICSLLVSCWEIMKNL